MLPNLIRPSLSRSLSIPIDKPSRPAVSPQRAKAAAEFTASQQRFLDAQRVERAAQNDTRAARDAATTADWEQNGPPLDLSGFR